MQGHVSLIDLCIRRDEKELVVRLRRFEPAPAARAEHDASDRNADEADHRDDAANVCSRTSLGHAGSVQFQHDLADMPLFAKDVLSGSDVTERIGLGHQWYHLLALDPSDQIAEYFRVKHSASKETEVLEV